MEKVKKLNVFKMTVDELKQACFDSKKQLLELSLISKKEHIGNFAHIKKTLKKNIARCLMVLN